MSAGNPLFSDNFRIGSISPQVVDNAAVLTDWVYAGNAANVVGIALVGATDAEVTITIQQAKDTSGTGAKIVTDATATISATQDNKDTVIQVEATKLDEATGFYYVALKIAVADGTAGASVAGVLLNESRHKPVDQPAKVVNDVMVVG